MTSPGFFERECVAKYEKWWLNAKYTAEKAREDDNPELGDLEARACRKKSEYEYVKANVWKPWRNVEVMTMALEEAKAKVKRDAEKGMRTAQDLVEARARAEACQ